MTSFVRRSSDVLELLEQLERSVNVFFERKDIDEDNLRTFRRLQRRYNAASEMIRTLQQRSPDYITDKRMSDYAATLQENAEAIAKQQKQLENSKRMNILFGRVRRTKDVLQQCEDDVKEFFDFLSNYVAETLRTEHSAEPAKYMPRSNVPHNPLRLTLDYNSTRCEGQLKSAVLNESGDMVVAVVASGQGGVGKTCALRGLATDGEIKDRFSGGILYIQLTHDSSLHTIIQEIRRAVACTGGGEHWARKLANLNTLSETVDEACHWFEPHACLFLIDDIWWVNDIDSDVFTIMRRMLNGESRLVYSSRDKRFLHRADRLIEFKVKEAQCELARCMLMTHAGFDLNDDLVHKNKYALEAILQLCQGLPLALGISGASVLLISRMKRANEKQNAWSDFYQDISSGRTDLLKEPIKGYGTLPKIVETSLRVLQNQNAGTKYAEWFRALCVLRKKQTVPLNTLRRLWGMKGLEEAERVAYTLFDVSVVQVWRDTDGVTMELHDLVLDIAMRQASERNETQQFFQTLVRNYIPVAQSDLFDEQEQHVAGGLTQQPVTTLKRRKLTIFNREKRPTFLRFGPETPAEDKGKSTPFEEIGERHVEFEAWWDTEVDGYIHDNLCRLLLHSGYYDELVGLLSRPQWIVKRLTEGGIYQVEQDIDYGREAMRLRESSEAYIMYHLDVVHLDMIAKAARMSWRAVSENPYEAWFRLYGHLVQYAQQCERTLEFINDIEHHAPRPWAKASVGFLPPVEGAVIEVLKSFGSIESLSANEDRVSFVWRSNNRVGVTQYNRITGRQRTQALPLCQKHEYLSFAVNANGNVVVTASYYGVLQIWDERSLKAVGDTLVGQGDLVSCVAVSADGSRIASGSRNGTVRIWDGRSGEKVGDALVDHAGSVLCVAVSSSGSRIVSGSEDKTVRIWDGCSGDAVGEVLVGHPNEVRRVAVSGDGSRIVSVSNYCRLSWVRVWDGRTLVTVGIKLFDYRVSCVALSADGSRIVCGSDDGTVRIWDDGIGKGIGKGVGNALVGHTGEVQCVALSGDGSHIFSGSRDKSMRTWDARGREAAGNPLLGHDFWVTCVAVSEDGSRIVTGSRDGTGRIWDGHSGEAVGNALVGHDGALECVGISRDARRIVSGAQDKTLRIWDGENGARLGYPLFGHTSRVICVAINNDGSVIVSGSGDMTVRIWDGRSGAIIDVLNLPAAVRAVGVDDDGCRVVSVPWYSDMKSELWEVRRTHTGETRCVMTSGDAAWHLTLRNLPLSWSSNRFEEVTAVMEKSHDGTLLQLATRDGHPLLRIDGTDLCFSRDASCYCKIMR